MSMRYLIWVVVIAVLALGWWWANSAMENVDSINEDNLEIKTTTLSAVGGYTGSGIATRSFDGQVFTHTVEADLDAPAEGKFYEGWLVIPSPFHFFSTGKLELSDGKYELIYTANKDYSDHPQVVITQETLANGLDGVSETHILEGSF